MMKLLGLLSKKLASKSYVYALLKELCFEFKMLHQYNGAFQMKNDKKKMEARIIIGSHGIEKGLSFSEPKACFGIPKIEYLLDLLLDYKKRYKDNSFINAQVGPISKYIEFHVNGKEKILNIINKYNQLTENDNASLIGIAAGTMEIKKENVMNDIKIDYMKFIKARHSYRSFSSEPVDLDRLYHALEIAQFAPSACNRQPWDVYIFQGDSKNELLKLQQGCLGFLEEIDKAILITVDYRNFFLNELHQAYVDGGLYAMSLINALHSLGLGTIPLTTGSFTKHKKEKLLKKWNIPKSGIPIMIIGVGNIKEAVRVAVSQRNDFKKSMHIV